MTAVTLALWMPAMVEMLLLLLVVDDRGADGDRDHDGRNDDVGNSECMEWRGSGEEARSPSPPPFLWKKVQTEPSPSHSRHNSTDY